MSGVDKLADVKPGDRVRVTFEGRYIEVRNDKCVFEVDGYGGEFTVMLASVEQPTFQIERIEPPLAVGDRVKNIKVAGYDSRTGVIENITTVRGRDYAIVSGFGDGFGLAPVDDYARVSA